MLSWRVPDSNNACQPSGPHLHLEIRKRGECPEKMTTVDLADQASCWYVVYHNVACNPDIPNCCCSMPTSVDCITKFGMFSAHYWHILMHVHKKTQENEGASRRRYSRRPRAPQLTQLVTWKQLRYDLWRNTTMPLHMTILSIVVVNPLGIDWAWFAQHGLRCGTVVSSKQSANGRIECFFVV